MNKNILVLLFVFTFLGTANLLRSQDNMIDEVVWVVGDEAILRSEVENMYLQLLLDRQRLAGDPFCIIPEQMAIQKLYLHQAKLDSITVPENQVSARLDYEINNLLSNAGSKEKLEEYYGKTLFAIRDEYRTAIRDQLTVGAMQEKLVSSVKVTPVEIRNYYDKVPQDSLPFIPTVVEVEILTHEPTISLKEVDEIKNRLREFTEQVQSGEREFSTLARLYSEDVESAKNGGELGLLGKGTLLPEFAAVAFDLNDTNRISRIVETEYGYHILQLIEKRGDRVNVRHILLRPHVAKEELDASISRLDSLRTEILDGKVTFEDATYYLSHDKDTRMNKGLMVNNNYRSDDRHRMGTSRFEMDELPSEIARVVSTMEVGDISAPFVLVNSKQKQVAAIIKLKSRILGHKASISDDYQTLRAIVENIKRNEMLEQWVKEKQKNTYIRINEKWRNCDFQLEGWVR